MVKIEARIFPRILTVILARIVPRILLTISAKFRPEFSLQFWHNILIRCGFLSNYGNTVKILAGILAEIMPAIQA